MNNPNNTSSPGVGLIRGWRVIYMGEIPGYPGILGKTQLNLYQNGFSLSSINLGSYSDVVSWIILKERSAYASPTACALWGPRHIRTQYLDQNKKIHTILLEMFTSIWLPKNASLCQDMLLLMKQHGIFDQFASSPES